ncbi:MAG: flagellar basal body P-ring protein FlgI [Alphaproteobacteria bacterium]
MAKKISFLSIVTTLFLFSANWANATSRIKDIADFEGIRENQLLGYGLVVGLNGTGDNIKSINFARESLISMLDKIGINARDGQLKSKNIAAVMVTANLPAFGRQGSKIDVIVSAMGDAKNLQGGTLLATPLIGADGETYAVAQGQIAVSGFSASAGGDSITRGVPTSGKIANGATIENEVPFSLEDMQQVRIALRNPDFTTSRRVADAINALLGERSARSLDPSTISLDIPSQYRGKIAELMTKIEQLKVQPDLPAKIVIDETSGIIIIGKDVKISRVAIAQGNLTIKVTEDPFVSQPLPFAGGDTTLVNNTEITVEEQTDRKLSSLDTGVSLQEMVDGLNALGVGPRDLISILQAIKASGALQADIEAI